MSTTFTHRHGHAVVSFSDELSWASALDLVGTIDLVVDAYFYSRVELIVSSPGGVCPALDYVVDALALRRAQGVHFRTRIISQASSAAAVLACLGDERVAEAGARLLFHRSRAINVEQITAHQMSELRTMLTHTDERWLALLAARAIDGAPRARSDFERSDRKVLELLWPELHGAPVAKRPPRKLRDLGRAVSAAVERAARVRDRDAFVRLYRHLFETELSISSRVAFALRLIDRIGSDAPAPARRPGGDALTVPEWHVLFPPHGEVPRDVLTRHTLVLGETGSGKTASSILPVVAAMAREPEERLGAALIIDPKRELGPVLERLAAARLHHVLADTVALNLMAGERWRLDALLRDGRWLSAATRILLRVASFVPSSPARVLLGHSSGHSNADFFDREGAALVLSVLGFVLMVTAPDAVPPSQWLDDDDEGYAVVDALIARAGGGAGERGPNAVALTAWLLDGSLLSPPCSETRLRVTLGPGGRLLHSPDSTWLYARIAAAALQNIPDQSSEGRDMLARVLGYWQSMIVADKQFAAVRASASAVCSDFASASIARTLYFGCEPGWIAGHARDGALDFARAVACGGGGPLVLFQPARDGIDNLVAVGLKALFFESVLDDPDRIRGGADLPLVGYVADEFHRFATSDPVHGEQSFLDTCRSAGAFCLLACQSVASIEHALARGPGNAVQNDAAVSIVWNNTASKLVFRSTDPKTAERVSELCPYQPGLAGVVRVRPISTLATGECYAVLADGRFERRQLEPFRGAGLEPLRARAGRAPSSRSVAENDDRS